ncbi:hypothetical protein SFR_3357 [Streptomyces sp. FR-008]|nr:hypothetical protein SFR_3357 [Streptomyces sp. FR-008]
MPGGRGDRLSGTGPPQGAGAPLGAPAARVSDRPGPP